MAAGRAGRGVRPLVVFKRRPEPSGRLPSSRVRRRHGELHEPLPWVLDYTAWNEENHPLQPTGKDPRRAAEYFNALTRYCPSALSPPPTCLTFPTWPPGFGASCVSPTVPGCGASTATWTWGSGSSERTSQLLRMVRGRSGSPRPAAWCGVGNALTTAVAPHTSCHPEAHAALLAKRLLSLAAISPRVTRVYYYQWRVPPHARMGKGPRWPLVGQRPAPTGCSARPAFFVIARASPQHHPRTRARRDRAGNCI